MIQNVSISSEKLEFRIISLGMNIMEMLFLPTIVNGRSFFCIIV